MDNLNLAGQVVSLLGGMVALLIFLLEYIRGRNSEKSFRPMAGWILALTGLTIGIFAGGALGLAKKSPFSADGRLLGVASGIGLLLLFGGTLLATLVPSVDRQLLITAALRVQQLVGHASRRIGTEPHQYVELGVRPTRRSRATAKRLDARRLPAGKVTVLLGAAGSGKSTALRAYVRRVSNRTRRMRRPDALTLYVDLGKIADIVEPITEAVVRDHLMMAWGSDAGLRSRLESQFDEAPWRWSYVVDLGATLTEVQVRQYIDALAHLVTRRPADRAIVAVRACPEGDEPHVEVAEPTARSRRALLARRGVHRSVNRHLLRRLDQDPELHELASNPDALALIAEHIDAIDPTASLHAIMASVIESCLHDVDALGGTPGAVRSGAERTAFHALTASESTAAAETRPLVLIGLGRAERGLFVFRNDAVVAHLAGDHLLRKSEQYPLMVALESEQWRPALVSALRSGDNRFRSDFVRDVTSALLDEASSINLGLSADSVPLPASFRWPMAALRALEVLSSGLTPAHKNELPAETREVADAYIRASMLSGGQAQQRAAIPVIPLATKETIVTLINNTLTTKANRILIAPILIRLADSDDFVTEIPITTRLQLLSQAFGFGVAATIAEAAQYRSNSFATAIKDMVYVGKLSAVITIVYALAAVKLDPGIWPVAAAVTALSASYLWSFSEWRPSSLGWGASAAGLAITATLLAAGGIRIFIGAIERLLELNLSYALINLTIAWFQTWPLAAILYVAVVAIPTEDRRWRFPHKHLLETMRGTPWNTLVPTSVRRRLPLLVSPQRVAAAAIGITSLVVIFTNLPLAVETQKAAKGIYFLGSIFAVVALLGPHPLKRSTSWRRLRWDRNHLASLSPDEVFEELKSSFTASGAAITRFLSTASKTEPGAMNTSAPLLQDLDSLLSFISDTVPDDMKKPLKPGLWRFAPDFEVPEFREWIIKFDRERPGLLPSLATSERIRGLSSASVLKARWLDEKP